MLRNRVTRRDHSTPPPSQTLGPTVALFIAQAHSFAQQARLAVTLAWVAGYVNSVSILALHTVTSHVSGTASNMGIAVVEGRWGFAGFELFILITFFAGAMLSGVAMEVGRRAQWQSIYVLPTALQAGMLGVLAFGLDYFAHEPGSMGNARLLFIALAAGAMGLQNATITRISSGVVRTTHITGVLTDLGTETVHFLFWLRDIARSPRAQRGPWRRLIVDAQRHQAARRLALLGSIVGSFAVGAGLGALMYGQFPRISMFPPVLFLTWLIYLDVRRPIAEIAQARIVAETDLSLPSSVGVYAITRDARRRDAHRLPNLIAWTDRLPPNIRVAILDLGEIRRIDSDAMSDIAAAVLRMEGAGRRLILAGLSAEHYAALQKSEGDADMGPGTIVADLELAIARALVLVESDPFDRAPPRSPRTATLRPA